MNPLSSAWRYMFGSGTKDSSALPIPPASSASLEEKPKTNSDYDSNNSCSQGTRRTASVINATGDTSHDHIYYECGEELQKVDDENISTVDQDELDIIGSNVSECTPLKLMYDDCFQNWFANDFLRGGKSMSPCEALLSEYTACVKRGLQEQDFIVYQKGVLHSTDPNDGCVSNPRDSVPPGATYHHADHK